jgi:hypothetical protein
MGVYRTFENRLQNASLPPTMRTGISVRPPLQYRVNVRFVAQQREQTSGGGVDGQRQIRAALQQDMWGRRSQKETSMPHEVTAQFGTFAILYGMVSTRRRMVLGLRGRCLPSTACANFEGFRA